MSFSNQNQNSEQTPRKTELPPEGINHGRLIWFFDLGTHDDTYEGNPTIKHKVLFGWELAAKMEDGRPFVVVEEFTISPSKFGGFYAAPSSNLNARIREWQGIEAKAAQNLVKIETDYLGKAGKLLIEHKLKGSAKGKSKAELTPADYKYNVVKVSHSDNAPEQVNPILTFTVGNPIPEGVPAFVRRKVEDSHEAKGITIERPAMNGDNAKPNTSPGSFDEDIPF